MGLIGRLFRQLQWQSRLPQLAEEIVDRVFESVWNRVGDRVIGMSVAESGGYTKVLAAEELSRQVDLSLVWLQLPQRWQPQLVAIASEQISARVLQRAQMVARYSKCHRRIA
jgi:hypothetical protein